MSNYSGFLSYNSDVGTIKNRVPVIKQDKALVTIDSPVEIDQLTGAMSGNILDVVTVATNTYTLSASDAGKQLYFTFNGAVTVTIPGAASQDAGVFWMWAAGPSTTLTFSKATGGDTLLGATSAAATESGTIVLRSGTIYENDPRYQSAGPGAGDVVGPASSTNTALAVYGDTSGKLLANSAFTTSGSTLTAANLAFTSSAGNISFTAFTGTVDFNNSTLSEVNTIAGNGGALAVTGSLTASTTLTATLGAITATNGNLVLGTAGNKLSIATGANASVGTSTLVGGTVTVNTTAVTASSIILLTRQSIGATGAAALGELVVGTVTPGASFVINAAQAADATSLQATDVSVIGWVIIN